MLHAISPPSADRYDIGTTIHGRYASNTKVRVYRGYLDLYEHFFICSCCTTKCNNTFESKCYTGVRSGMSSESDGEEDTHVGEPPAEPTRFVRVSLRPPPRYTASSDLELWLKRFELYVRQTGLHEDQWAAELLPLLDDTAFRVVLQLGLAESTDYKTITESLRQQFSPKGNELEWQRRLQTRRQQPAEQLVQYAGALRVLADKAYPNWTAEQRGEVLRNHFIQGVSSASVHVAPTDARDASYA